jgi:hypothetical protein
LNLDRLEELLIDPAVLGHTAAAMRRDAACALGMLGTRHPSALIAILDDEDVTVARAAWLSLWMLTGHPFGLERDDLFHAIPTAVAEIEHVRDGLFTRPGVSAAQRVAVEAMIRDDLRRADAARRYRELIESQSSGAWAH